VTKIAVDRDEIYPYYIADSQYVTPEYHDVVLEVEDAWWAEYQEARDKFWAMQSELGELYGE